MAIKKILGTALCSVALLYAAAAKAESCGSSQCNEYLIKFTNRATPDQINQILARETLSVEQYFETTGVYHTVGDGSRPSEEVIENLNADPNVSFAEPNYEIRADSLPNDPLFSELWAFQNTGQYSGGVGIDIGMMEVWNNLINPEPVVIAVVDSGIDYTHPDLADNMWKNPGEIPGNQIDDDGNGYVDDVYGYDFVNNDSDPKDDYFHGTHVAGIIGAVANNGVGITGMNWNARLMALKFMRTDGAGPLSAAMACIDYAVKMGAKVINNSWSFTYPGLTSLPASPSSEPVQSLRFTIQKADQAGVVFVAAAGNGGLNADYLPNYPAAYTVGNVLSVTATDNKDQLANFSNYGSVSVDMGAPGVLIESTFPLWKITPPYKFMSGTSQAAPFVAGAAALLMAENPDLSHRQVIQNILQGVHPIAALSGKTLTGGRLDLAQAFALVSPSSNHSPVAYAGATQNKTAGSTVTLSGTATDSDGDSPLIYQWSLSVPSGSAAKLNSYTSSTTSFPADKVGTYYATLVVSDAKSSSTPVTAAIYVIYPTISALSEEGGSVTEGGFEMGPSTVVIAALSETSGEPLDPATGNQIKPGESVLLDGTQSIISTDAVENLEFHWAFVEKPAGSEAALGGSDMGIANLRPDLSGTYTLELSISDGKRTSLGEYSFLAVPAVSEQTGGGEEIQGGTPSDGAAASGGCSLAP